jgi:hypothetical protein
MSDRLVAGAGSTVRQVSLQGWNLADPPAPISITAKTVYLMVNGVAIAAADGTITRDNANSASHTFEFDDDAQFQALVPGDKVKILLLHDTAGDGVLAWEGEALVFEADIVDAPQDVDALLDALLVNLLAGARDDAIALLQTWKRTGASGNTALELTDSASAVITMPIVSTNPDAEPITELSAPA